MMAHSDRLGGSWLDVSYDSGTTLVGRRREIYERSWAPLCSLGIGAGTGVLLATGGGLFPGIGPGPGFLFGLIAAVIAQRSLELLQAKLDDPASRW